MRCPAQHGTAPDRNTRGGMLCNVARRKRALFVGEASEYLDPAAWSQQAMGD